MIYNAIYAYRGYDYVTYSGPSRNKAVESIRKEARETFGDLRKHKEAAEAVRSIKNGANEALVKIRDLTPVTINGQTFNRSEKIEFAIQEESDEL